MEILEFKTEKRVVKDLIPYEKNPRKITTEDKEKLKKSLEEFGLTEIPGIDTDGTLIWGHQRCKAMIELGLGDKIIDVRVANRKLTEDEFKKLNVRSNISAGSWDFDMLAVDFGIDALTEWGFKENLDKEFATSAISYEEEVNELPQKEDMEIIVKRGDLFEINGHRILCGDSTSQEDVSTLMNGHLAQMVFTDPPYNVKINNIVGLGKIKHAEFKQASGEMSEVEFTNFLKSIFEQLLLHSAPGSIHYICMDWKHIYELISAQKMTEYEFKNLCVWVKDNGGMGTFYRSKHELVFVLKKPGDKHINNFELGQSGRYRTNVWEYAGANSFSSRGKDGETSHLKMHPTVKPTDLVIDAIVDCSYRDGVILDLFLGSGTTMIACEKSGRKSYGMELDEGYVQVAIVRYLNLLKQQQKPIHFNHINGSLSANNFLSKWKH